MVFGWFKKRKVRHTFDDEDREISLKIRQEKTELRRIQQETKVMQEKLKLERAKAELEDLKDELYGLDDEPETHSTNPDSLITTLLINAMLKDKANTTSISNPYDKISYNNNIPQQNQTELTDEEIDKLIDIVPKNVLKQSARADDALITRIITSKLPNLSPQSNDRMLKRIRSRFPKKVRS